MGKRFFVMLGVILFLNSCGGGNGDSNNDEEKDNGSMTETETIQALTAIYNALDREEGGINLADFCLVDFSSVAITNINNPSLVFTNETVSSNDYYCTSGSFNIDITSYTNLYNSELDLYYDNSVVDINFNNCNITPACLDSNDLSLHGTLTANMVFILDGIDGNVIDSATKYTGTLNINNTQIDKNCEFNFYNYIGSSTAEGEVCGYNLNIIPDLINSQACTL